MVHQQPRPDPRNDPDHDPDPDHEYGARTGEGIVELKGRLDSEEQVRQWLSEPQTRRLSSRDGRMFRARCRVASDQSLEREARRAVVETKCSRCHGQKGVVSRCGIQSG